MWTLSPHIAPEPWEIYLRIYWNSIPGILNDNELLTEEIVCVNQTNIYYRVIMIIYYSQNMQESYLVKLCICVDWLTFLIALRAFVGDLLLLITAILTAAVGWSPLHI